MKIDCLGDHQTMQFAISVYDLRISCLGLQLGFELEQGEKKTKNQSYTTAVPSLPTPSWGPTMPEGNTFAKIIPQKIAFLGFPS